MRVFVRTTSLATTGIKSSGTVNSKRRELSGFLDRPLCAADNVPASLLRDGCANADKSSHHSHAERASLSLEMLHACFDSVGKATITWHMYWGFVCHGMCRKSSRLRHRVYIRILPDAPPLSRWSLRRVANNVIIYIYDTQSVYFRVQFSTITKTRSHSWGKSNSIKIQIRYCGTPPFPYRPVISVEIGRAKYFRNV